MELNRSIFRPGWVGAFWCLSGGLLLGATAMLWFTAGRPAESLALGATVPAAPVRAWSGRAPSCGGVSLLPLRLGAHQWGLVLLDTPHHVFAIYRVLPSARRVQLIAVRNYRYDLKLTDFNNASPTPAQVRQMVRGVGASIETKVAPRPAARGK